MKFSKAVIKLAKKRLKQYEKESDRNFLVRAKLDRILREL